MAYFELVDGYQIEYDAKGITAQRQFIESDTVPAGNETVTLPVIGDIFHDPAERLQHLFCTKITQKYINSDKRKVLYTCYYSNEPVDNSNMLLEYTPPTDPGELPQVLEYAGEINLWKAPTTETEQVWRWESQSGEGVKAIPFRIRTYNKKVNRIIPESKYRDYIVRIQECLGKVNGKAIWNQDGGDGCWLFTGARSELFRDQRDDRAYLFELTFSYRDPDGTDEDGWQKILNSKGEWLRPYNSDSGEFMYPVTDLNILFDENA